MNSRRFLPCLLLLLAMAPAGLAQKGEVSLANEYFNEGEYAKALSTYKKLVQRHRGNDFYVYRAAECYRLLEQYDKGLTFIEEVIDKSPGRPQYVAVRADLLAEAGDTARADKLREKLLDKQLADYAGFSGVSSYYMRRQRYDRALKVYLKARETLKDETLFAQNIAKIYQVQDRFGKATREYLRPYLATGQGFPQARSNILRMVKADDNRPIERALLRALVDNEKDMSLRRLVYDFYLRAENYSEALVQAKSLERLGNTNGKRLYELANTLQSNSKYELSNQALNVIIDEYEDSPYYLRAYFEKAKNFELQVVKQKPVDTSTVREAVNNYNELLGKYGRRPRFHEAMYSKAKLSVFYLGELEAARKELEAIVNLSIPGIKKAEAKLLIGDIHLIQGEYARAQQKYRDVDKQFQAAQVGAEAKFKLSKLHYYKGDFKLAKAQLKILKDNASNDIANDAIDLFLLIQDNSGMDTSTVPLQRFASAQLQLYQNNLNEASRILDSLLYEFPEHNLADEIYWEQSKVALRRGKLDKALGLIDKILEDHADAVLADNALFKKAELHQYNLDKPDQAKELYLDLLMKYPGSLYKVEARKRLRELRGEDPDAPPVEGHNTP